MDAHLDSCPECRRWFDDAARITRLARTGVAQSTPDLVSAVMAQAPVVGRARVTAILRGALALIGASQLALAVAQVFGPAQTADGQVIGSGMSMAHLAHESAAWNLALGVGFLWVAYRIDKATGLLPTLTAFIGLLTLLSLLDFLTGRVDVARLVTHVLVFLGYGVILALAARQTDGPGLFPWPARARGHQPRPSTSDSDAGAAPPETGAEGPGLRPTARRDAA